jgi:hypothetical protein
MDDVITFNDGSIGRTKIVPNIRFEPGRNMTEGLNEIYGLCFVEVIPAAEQIKIEATTKSRMQKRMIWKQEHKIITGLECSNTLCDKMLRAFLFDGCFSKRFSLFVFGTLFSASTSLQISYIYQLHTS